MAGLRVELTPMGLGPQPLSGFVVAGRWPDGITEWTQLLALIVRLGALPGMLDETTVLMTRDEKPEVDSGAPAVGVLARPVPATDPSGLIRPAPAAIVLLHPPRPGRGPAGCLLLPGLPHLGLDHRAGWVQTDTGGALSRMVSHGHVDPMADPDTAALVGLLAA